MNFLITKTRSVNGVKVRDISEICDTPYGKIEVEIATEVKTPNCGWVNDGMNPSFDCKGCNKSCPEYKKWIDFYKDEGLL